MPTPRIAPLQSPDDEVAEILATTAVGNERGEALRIFRTLAHHPRLLRRFNALAGTFMAHGELDRRLREIVILRVAWLSNCAYEWGQHVEIAQRCDLSREEIVGLAQQEPVVETLSAIERLGVEAAGQLVDTSTLDHQTWSQLGEHLSDSQMLEMIALVGFYRMTAGILNAVAVQPEEWLQGFPGGEGRA